MPDDNVVIKATAGPYKGKRLTVSAADGKAAIKDGWAIDPFADPGEAKDLSDEERGKIAEKAETAARRLRGEEAGEKAGEKEDRAELKTRAMEAEESADYQTRSTRAKSDKK